MLKHKRCAAIALSALITAACSSSSNDSGDDSNDEPNSSSDSGIERFEFLSYKVPCFGVGQRLCLKTRGNELFFSPVEGFDFVWGHAYELSLKVSMVEDPAADESSLKYELEEVISDSEDSVGTLYEYERVDLLDLTFIRETGVYSFLGQSFLCPANVDCDGLIGVNNSGGSVNVVFEYAGNGEIELVRWN